MTLVVGLGNPGPTYKNNRHNIGFMVIDKFIYDLNPSKVNKSSFNGELYKTSNTLFLKPHTFMNNSGLSVIQVIKYFDVNRIIVIHDDIELPFGSIRIKHGGGNGGHNGLKSLDAHIGKDYDRIRLGISKPANKEDVADFVLSNFSNKERLCLPKIISYASEALEYLLSHNAAECASKYNIKKSLCEEPLSQEIG